MRKILFITTNDWTSWGGSEVLWYKLALVCLNNRLEVGVCIKNWHPTPKHILDLKNNGATIITRDDPYVSSSIIKSIKNKLFSTPARIKIFKKVVDYKPQIIIICQGGNMDGLDWMDFSCKRKIPYCTIVQAATESWWPNDSTSIKLGILYKNAVRNFFVSEANFKLTQIQIGTKLNNTKVVRNPFNVDYNNTIRYPETQNNFFQLANVARFEMQAKGQDVLMEVLSDPKWQQRPIKVNLFGSGAHVEQIHKLISYFGIKNKIEIEGYSNTEKIWKENHALILPSRYEGLPLALVEAMLCGRFGIVTNVSGNKEVIIDNVNGFIAAAPKPEYLDEAMERAWQQRDKWKEIGLNAKEYIKTLIPENPVQILFDDIVQFI